MFAGRSTPNPCKEPIAASHCPPPPGLEDAREVLDKLNAEPQALQEARLADIRDNATRIRMDLSVFQGASDPSAALRARIEGRHDEARPEGHGATPKRTEPEDFTAPSSV